MKLTLQNKNKKSNKEANKEIKTGSETRINNSVKRDVYALISN